MVLKIDFDCDSICRYRFPTNLVIVLIRSTLRFFPVSSGYGADPNVRPEIENNILLIESENIDVDNSYSRTYFETASQVHNRRRVNSYTTKSFRSLLSRGVPKTELIRS